MPYDAKVLKVFVASPGDVQAFRVAVERIVHEWNRDHSEDRSIVLRPIRWEVDSFPALGGDAQSLVNEQLVDAADICIAVFHSRLGGPTPRAESGTAEEISRMHAAGKPVHVFRFTGAIPQPIDAEQLRRLDNFLVTLEAQGIIWRFDSADEFRDAVQRTIISDIRTLASGSRRKSLDLGTVVQREPQSNSVAFLLSEGPTVTLRNNAHSPNPFELDRMLSFSPYQATTAYELMVTCIDAGEIACEIFASWKEEEPEGLMIGRETKTLVPDEPSNQSFSLTVAGGSVSVSLVPGVDELEQVTFRAEWRASSPDGEWKSETFTFVVNKWSGVRTRPTIGPRPTRRG